MRNLDQIEKGKNGTYVLHHCGTPTSSITGLPADAVHAPRFEVPIRSVSTDVTVGLAFLEALELFDTLDIADMTYVSSPCLQALRTRLEPWTASEPPRRVVPTDGHDLAGMG